MATAAHHSIGDPNGLKFDICWPIDADTKSSSPAFGELTVWIGPKLVWGNSEDGKTAGVGWYWDELLDLLARSWPFLPLEESYPLGILPKAPSLFRSAVRERWIGVSEELIEAEDNSVSGFEQVHDLSEGAEGITLPSLFFVREGNLMIAGTSHGVDRLPFFETLRTLEDLGNSIAERLKGVGGPRAEEILKAWAARSEIEDATKVELASSLPLSKLTSLAGAVEFDRFWEISANSNEPNELMAAARMIGGLVPDEDTRLILEAIRAQPLSKTNRLDELSAEAEEFIADYASAIPHEQGRILAEWLRKRPGVVESNGTLNLDQLLSSWGVKTQEIMLASENLDALCVWGPKYGPSILVNKRGRLAHFPTGRRSTLAHEMCHLLIDRNGSLPLAEVFGGAVPKYPEQRANAFGAELLLPQAAAQTTWAKSRSVEDAMQILSEQYQVSYEVAAWQILKTRDLPSKDRAILLKHTYRFGSD